MTDDFIPGLELSGSFFREVVGPRLDESFGADRYAAVLNGPGSEVLGLDTPMSADHDWGPRVIVVVSETDRPAAQAAVGDLPDTFAGHSLAFGAKFGGSPWIHPVDIVTVDQMFKAWIGANPLDGMTLVDWLSAPSNGLLMLTAGELFHDGPGELSKARAAIDWYPPEIWTWLLSCQWRRISQEHSFVGRAADAGSDVGSRILAARLARDCVRLAFLIEQKYAPYEKWLGPSLSRLQLGKRLEAVLHLALDAPSSAVRQEALADAYEILGHATNGLGIAREVDPSPRLYYSRPHRVGAAGEFAAALLDSVTTPALRSLRPHGAADQFIDSTDAGIAARKVFAALLAGDEPPP